MNFKPTIFVLALLFFSISVFGQYKYIQKFGNLATVALPDSPALIDMAGEKMYLTKYHEKWFVGEIGEVGSGYRDLFKKDIDSAYREFVKGMGGHIFFEEKITIDGREGFEVGCKGMAVSNEKIYRYFQFVALNDTLVDCAVWSTDSLSKNDKTLRSFFNGFKIKTRQQLINDQIEELAHKSGKFIITLIVIVVFLSLGIVFLKKRMFYKRKHQRDT